MKGFLVVVIVSAVIEFLLYRRAKRLRRAELIERQLAGLSPEQRALLQRAIQQAAGPKPPPLPEEDPLCVRHLIAGAHAEYPRSKREHIRPDW